MALMVLVKYIDSYDSQGDVSLPGQLHRGAEGCIQSSFDQAKSFGFGMQPFWERCLQFDILNIFKRLVLLLVLLLNLTIHVNGQETWCGKNYRQGTPVIDPGGHYPIPSSSEDPLLLFSCEAAIKPYIENDDATAGVLVSLEITHVNSHNTSPAPSTIRPDSKFLIQLSTEGVPLLSAGTMGLGRNQLLTFPLFALGARKEPHELACTALFIGTPASENAGDTQPDRMGPKEAREAVMNVDVSETPYKAFTQLAYLPPNPHGGSVVKIDTLTKAMLVRTEAENGSEWRPIFPFGFYTSFGGYLAKNPSALYEIADRGYNLVHPVPTFDNLTALDEVLDKMESLGLWLMYDMRWSYKNSTAVEEEVNRIKSRKNLLLWYTADEPDGWVDELGAPKRAYDQINDLDGYHPISLVLNCQDYYFANYSTGADILLHDTYPIGINATWSTVYNTSCTEDYGDCGCDNCVRDSMDEISKRLDDFYQRLSWEGRESVGVWSVGQAFGGESFWDRAPTGPEFAIQAVLSVIHGAKGIVSWLAPVSKEIEGYAIMFAELIPTISKFTLNSAASFQIPTFSLAEGSNTTTASIDLASWTTESGKLFMGVNLSNHPGTVILPAQDYGSINEAFIVRATAKIEHDTLEIQFAGQGLFVVLLR